MRGWSRKPNCSESDSRTDVGDYGERCFSEHLCKSIQEEETKTLGHSEVTDPWEEHGPKQVLEELAPMPHVTGVQGIQTSLLEQSGPKELDLPH